MCKGQRDREFRHFFSSPLLCRSEWRPNLDMFERAIKPHEDRIKNVYFTYLFLLRAVAKSAPLLQRFDFNTGNPSEDKHTALLVEELLGSSLLCNPTFNDSVLISENANVVLFSLATFFAVVQSNILVR